MNTSDMINESRFNNSAFSSPSVVFHELEETSFADESAKLIPNGAKKNNSYGMAQLSIPTHNEGRRSSVDMRIGSGSASPTPGNSHAPQLASRRPSRSHSPMPHRQRNASQSPHSVESSIDFSTETDYQASSSSKRSLFDRAKTLVVFVFVIIMSIIIAVSPERTIEYQEYSVNRFFRPTLDLKRPDWSSILIVRLRGHFLYSPVDNYDNVTLMIEQIPPTGQVNATRIKETWVVAVSNELVSKEVLISKQFPLISKPKDTELNITINIGTETIKGVPFGLDYDFLTENNQYVIIYAGLILLMVYALIIFELVHRVLAAILGSLATVAVMSATQQRPSLNEMIGWLDFETLTLLFGMMLTVSIFAETGFFDWIALQAYKLAKGQIWPLMIILCAFASVISAFLDNVTTILLLSPVTIRLCEALRMDPRRLLVAEVIFANIGGTATAVGDPPNVIIASSSELQAKGVTFINFTLHMSVGIIFITIAAFGMLRILYRDIGKASDDSEESYEVVELCREIEVWKRQAFSITVATKEEATIRALLLQKVVVLENELVIKRHQKVNVVNDYKQTIEDMEQKYRITNKVLLAKCSFVLIVVIICFFASAFESFHLNLGWVAFLGSVWLLVLSDFAELEPLLDRVEWATLIFFAALFALMEALQKLGLITWIGNGVSDLILSLPPDARLPIAILTITWVSALASAFIDNIPFTTAMIPIILQLSDTLPILPMVWSLAFGACLGGNGTLIGASANVVAAGIAQQHGYSFTFKYFFKVGFPMMLWTTLIATIYLLICHVAFDWNYS